MLYWGRIGSHDKPGKDESREASEEVSLVIWETSLMLVVATRVRL